MVLVICQAALAVLVLFSGEFDSSVVSVDTFLEVIHIRSMSHNDHIIHKSRYCHLVIRYSEFVRKTFSYM